MIYYALEEAPLSPWTSLMIKMAMPPYLLIDSSTKETLLGIL
jgi:hypothetical protein